MNNRRGKRGTKSQQKREMLLSILPNCFFDDERCELVVVKQFDYHVTLYQNKYPFKTASMLELAEKGEVLVDSHGSGTLQRR